MAIPKPEVGAVVCFSYVWQYQYEKGEVSGRKDRPCALVAVVENIDGLQEVTVLPITHQEPPNKTYAVEIWPKTRARFGLKERSWIICSEGNEFIWPGYDLAPIPKRTPKTYLYGLLPKKLFTEVQERIELAARGPKLKIISRKD